MKELQVLIIDDEAATLESLKHALSSEAGCRVYTAQGGSEGIAIAKKRTLDICLIDLMMPFKNGIDTLTEIKSIQPGTSALIVTAYPDEHLEKRAYRRGACGILFKPFPIERLLAIIRKVAELRNLLRGEA